MSKERKKTEKPREGWEDGTPPPHRDFKERSVVLAVAHPRESASSYLSSQSLVPERKKERKQTRQTRDGTRTRSPPARAGFWKDDQGDRWGSPAPDKGHDRLASAVHGGIPTPLAVSSQSSDLPPASRWQSLATTGTLTQGWQGRRQPSHPHTYYAGLPH